MIITYAKNSLYYNPASAIGGKGLPRSLRMGARSPAGF